MAKTMASLQASHSSLLPRAVSRPNSLPLPFRTPATQAIQKPPSEVRLFDTGFTDQAIAALYVIPFKVTKNIKLSMF